MVQPIGLEYVANRRSILVGFMLLRDENRVRHNTSRKRDSSKMFVNGILGHTLDPKLVECSWQRSVF